MDGVTKLAALYRYLPDLPDILINVFAEVYTCLFDRTIVILYLLTGKGLFIKCIF